MSLREIAKREGLSFARIKQIQDKALIKLQKRVSREQFYELLNT
jgi:DNA-directed RNA polymerase sigma subunit (sigma70/sigma32)